MALESSLLRAILRRKIRREIERPKYMGINPHAGEEHVDMDIHGSYTDEKSGKIVIHPLGIIGGSSTHELAHRAHILRSYAPTKRMRRDLAGKYMKKVPIAFGAISETLAHLSEKKTWNSMVLERETKEIYDHYAVDVEPAAAILAVRNAVLDMWKTLRQAGITREDARKTILLALYNSKGLKDIELRKMAVKDFAELKKHGVDVNLDEILAMWALRRWKP